MLNPLKPKHNYQKKVKKLIENGNIPEDVSLGEVEIRHDDWCGLLKGGICNCDPDLAFMPVYRFYQDN